jgi:UDP-sugar transporter A1/2/3
MEEATRDENQIRLRIRIGLVVALVLQNATSSVVGKMTRTLAPSSTSDDLYSINHFLIAAESSKFVFSLLLEIFTSGSMNGLISIRLHIFQNPVNALKGSFVPALLYFISNTMQYVAMTYLSAPVLQVLIQSKLVTTAILSVLVLGRTYSTQQWIALMVLSLGVAIVIIDEEGGAEMRKLSGDVNADNAVRGILAVAVACIVSSLAGVYFEKVLKQNQQGLQPSLWLRNMLLSFFSVLIALFQSLLHDNSARRQGSFVYKPFFHGFAPLVWLQVFLLSCGGILVAAVMKYTDNVIKGLATGISVVVSALLSAVFLGTVISTPFLFGAGMILFAVMFFFDLYQVRLPWMPSRWLNRNYISRDPPHRNKFIFSLCVVCLASYRAHMSPSIVHLAENKTTSTRGELMNASDVTNHILQLANSNESLNNLLRLMEEDIHDSTQIIYGIRTLLGDHPATYLEIGSHNGSSFMLKHPFPTHVMSADSCDLSLNDMHSRNDAILKNFSSLGQHGCTLSSLSKRNLVCPPNVLAEETYDIISVGGNHSAIGVWSEFNHIVKFIRPGGFIVCDLDALPDARSTVESSMQRTDVVKIGRTRSNAIIFQKLGHSEPKPLLVPTTAPVMCVCCLYS